MGHLQPAGLPSLSAPYDSHAVCLWAFLWGSGASQGHAGASGVLVVVQFTSELITAVSLSHWFVFHEDEGARPEASLTLRTLHF